MPIDWRDDLTADCRCEFTPYAAESQAEDPDEQPDHYLRACASCGAAWYSLHCPHDGFQGKCPECQARATRVGQE